MGRKARQAGRQEGGQGARDSLVHACQTSRTLGRGVHRWLCCGIEEQQREASLVGGVLQLCRLVTGLTLRVAASIIVVSVGHVVLLAMQSQSHVGSTWTRRFGWL